MVERGKSIDPHLGVALEAVLPDADVLVDHLVVAPAVDNQDRQVEAARDRDFIACVEIIVVRRGRAEEKLLRRHLVRRDFIGLALDLRKLLQGRLTQVSQLLNDHSGQLAAKWRQQHESSNAARLVRDFRRHRRTEAVPHDENPVARHLPPAAQQPHRRDAVLDDLFFHRDLLRIERLVRVGAFVVSKHDDSARAQPFRQILEDVIGADRLVAILRPRSRQQHDSREGTAARWNCQRAGQLPWIFTDGHRFRTELRRVGIGRRGRRLRCTRVRRRFEVQSGDFVGLRPDRHGREQLAALERHRDGEHRGSRQLTARDDFPIFEVALAGDNLSPHRRQLIGGELLLHRGIEMLRRLGEATVAQRGEKFVDARVSDRIRRPRSGHDRSEHEKRQQQKYSRSRFRHVREIRTPNLHLQQHPPR